MVAPVDSTPSSFLDRREFLQATALGVALGWTRIRASETPVSSSLETLQAAWLSPPEHFWPRTRWWWPGNAVTREEIRRELEGMRANGIRGVELTSIWPVYEKGNIPYLSERWLQMVRYAIECARELGMSFALTMGPGWDFGGFWVPPEHRSKCLACGWTDAEGGTTFEGELPGYVRPKDKGAIPWIDEKPLAWTAPDSNQVIAVVAGRIRGEGLEEESLTDLSALVKGNALRWKVPPGQWRLMAFRLLYTGQKNSAQDYEPENWVIDHYNREAVAAYCSFLGNTFGGTFGEHFGKTVDSFFSDSFEVAPLWNTLLWSNDLLRAFRARMGYDFTRYLPAIWFSVGEKTARLRYDLNAFLHATVMDTFFAPFTEWCEKHQVQARLQPHYRFSDEVIEAAGRVPRPETEISTARFETIADPRKATVSGARFYGRETVSCEAYTFLHRERYRTTLEEMKRATDAFFREGVTQFYNHGYLYSPEAEPAPSRDFVATTRVSHWNTWWPYYRGLAEYIARVAAVLRQGRFVGDVLLYSPHADFWSARALFEIERRYQNYGDVPQVLVSHGYDYDLVNDDVLLGQARPGAGGVEIRGHQYPVVVLPGCEWIPLKSLQKLKDLVAEGATLMALQRLPSGAPGMRGTRDGAAVRKLVATLFAGAGRRAVGKGCSWFLPDYPVVKPPLNTNEIPYAPPTPRTPVQKAFLDALAESVLPDMAHPEGRQSAGLCHHHRKLPDADVYFLTNLHPGAVEEAIRFRATGRRAFWWDPLTGAQEPAAFQTDGQRSVVQVSLTPWASRILVMARDAGSAAPEMGAPQPLAVGETREIGGPWSIEFEGLGGKRGREVLGELRPWNEWEAWKHFSGKGVYTGYAVFDEGSLRANSRWLLDLGRVGDVAELRVNGRACGVRWMQPYVFDVSAMLRPGRNEIRIAVTNTLMPYVSGMTENPPVPEALRERFGNEATRFPDALRVAKREFGYAPLPAAGLMGPVMAKGLRQSP
jgi:hypothetical protein